MLFFSIIAFVRINQVSLFFSPLIQKPYFSLTIFTLEFKMPTVGLEIQLMGTALAFPTQGPVIDPQHRNKDVSNRY